MTTVHAAWALLPEGFVPNVRLHIAGGRLESVTPGAAPGPQDESCGVVVPGMADLHSHAFQRVFAGHSQHIAGGSDFWSWREAMYRAASRMTPALMAPVMAWLAKEKLRGGYTSTAEFHYLHHQPAGRAYAPPQAMAAALAEGAAIAGLPLTVLFTVYERGGFDGRSLAEGQARFACGLDQAAALAASLPESSIFQAGLALHSLRAATPASVARASTVFSKQPIHIHVSEQTAEVAECIETLGAPPIAWLLDHAEVDPRWCLVHATHANPAEITAFAARGAVAGLCPSTEADLGDGIFDLPALLQAQGAFGIGADSNTCLDACAELRLLEYGQRLKFRKRNITASAEISTATALWAAAARGGAQACGRGRGEIAAGEPADLVVLAPTPEADGASPARLLDCAMFAATRSPIRHVMAGGIWQVRDFRHVAEAAIDAAYARALAELAA